MLFSGVAQNYRCSSCNQNFSNYTPTSVIPILFVTIVSASLWCAVIDALLKSKLIALVLGFFLSIGLFLLALWLFQKLTASWLKSGCCPECGTKLEAVSGGFVDGGSPAKAEIVMYIVLTAIPAALLAILQQY